MLKETYSQIFVYLPGFASYLQTCSAQKKLENIARRIRVAKALDEAPDLAQSVNFADFPYARTLAANAGLTVASTRQYFIFSLCHLVADLRTLHIHPEAIVYTVEEQTSIEKALDELLREHGFRIESSASSHWVVSSEQHWDLSSTPYYLALGEDLLLKDLQGDDAIKMKKLQMELQMLLSAHPVNQAREASSETSANAMWVWGQSDKQSDTILKTFAAVFGDEFFANASQSAEALIPEKTGTSLKQSRALLGSFQFLSANSDEDALLKFCETWLQPLLLSNKYCDRCYLYLDNSNWLELKNTWSWRFWQRS